MTADGQGNNADLDRDGDGISNEYELLIGTNDLNAKDTPPDLDADSIPDSQDKDRDGDGFLNSADRFPDDKTEWWDMDNDGRGDNTDLDIDGDNISNEHELMLGFDPKSARSVPNDMDGDRLPDVMDDDMDGDDVANDQDVFPQDRSEWVDMDNDGQGDNSDADRDGDNISNDHELTLSTDPNDPKSVPVRFGRGLHSRCA